MKTLQAIWADESGQDASEYALLLLLIAILLILTISDLRRVLERAFDGAGKELGP